MKLTPKQQQDILSGCALTRPGATIRKVGGSWAALWSVEYDGLIDPDTKAPPSKRWRCQLVTQYALGEVWWSGEEHQCSTRKGAVEMATAEAAHFDW